MKGRRVGSLKALAAQIMKFGVVGVIAFFIDYGLLALLTEVFGLYYLLSATISFIVSVIFNYVASMRYVFTHKEGLSRRREFLIFVVLSVLGLLLNNACMWAGVELLGVHYLIVKIGATVIVAIWNFVTRKIFLDAGNAQTETQSVADAVDADVADAAAAHVADAADASAPGADINAADAADAKGEE